MTQMIQTERALDRMQPDTPPSQRYSRLVRVGRALVLELRDPNEGQGSSWRSDKTRHQYVVAGGQLWNRRLPPESVGDEWMDQPGPVRWEATGIGPHAAPALATYLDEAPDHPVVVVRRLPMQVGRDDTYQVRGENVPSDEVDDVEILAGPITDAWWTVPLPPCPDCGGDLVWAEAGLVPGARRCMGQPVAPDERGPRYDVEGGCGSLYTVDTMRLEVHS